MTEPTAFAPHRTEVPGPEWAALATIEITERLAGRVALAIGSGDTARALALLGALVDETTTRTATAVKAQALSDGIAHHAAGRVRLILAAVDAELEAEAARLAELSTRAKADVDAGRLVEEIEVGPGHFVHTGCTEEDCEVTWRALTTGLDAPVGHYL